jgi:hypothetical protein
MAFLVSVLTNEWLSSSYSLASLTPSALVQMEDRIRKKRHKIVQTKTGSPNPMKVVFNK